MESKTTRGQGLDRVLGKLKVSVENGNYYEAHQMYRTLYFRYFSQKKYGEVLDLLYDGAVLFIKHNQMASGSDLANLLVDVLVKSGSQVTDEYIDKLGRLYSIMESDSIERNAFLNAAIRWSAHAESGESVYPSGHPRLHQLVALSLWKGLSMTSYKYFVVNNFLHNLETVLIFFVEKSFAQSRYHFLRSADGSSCANMLIEYHITKGYPSEVDLFIAQAVFQYLCLKNKSTATVVFYSYTKKHPDVSCGPPFLLPLLNFLYFLLTALEQGKLAVFTVLCEQYQPSITRDPMYHEYLDRIGQLFFGLPPPPKQQQGGLFGNLIQSLIGSLDDDGDESEEVPGPSTTRPVLQPVQHEELD